MKVSNIIEGDIYSIPLFLTSESVLKSFSRFKFGLPEQKFCFCRLISDEGGSGILIEVFDYVGAFNSRIEDILSTPRLFNPISIAGLGIKKKRWRKIGETDNYDKEKDSKYSEITLIIGPKDNMRVWRNQQEYPLTEFTDVDSIEPFDIWPELQVENRIVKLLSERK
jgi:hypothetical protein